MQVNRRHGCASDRARGLGPYTPAVHFGPDHPLARLAGERCAAAGHRRTWRGACGQCWERAVRDDERFVVECDLPRELVADPRLVDEVAVALACSAEPVALSRAELAAAVAHLADLGLDAGQIGRRLGRDSTVVRRVLDGVTTDTTGGTTAVPVGGAA